VTSDGPARATEILVHKVYRDGAEGLDLGGSSAQSVILMLIVIVVTALQFRYVERPCAAPVSAAPMRRAGCKASLLRRAPVPFLVLSVGGSYPLKKRVPGTVGRSS
jgi:hypothetical protein